MNPDKTTLRWQAVRQPKRGHALEEYEDAWAANPAVGRFAVADGASESSHAALWARLLAEAFVAPARRPWDWTDWLAAPRRRWAAETDGLTLPWYAEIKRAQGAFATLLGLATWPGGPGRPGRWRALAVGDSCLFRVRGGRLSLAFPLRRSADFGSQPPLLGSRRGPTLQLDQAHSSFRPGDRLFLMTDALAQWFLRSQEQGGRPWEEVELLLTDPDPQAAFPAWVEDHRDRNDLRNDDVTLLSIALAFPPDKE